MEQQPSNEPLLDLEIDYDSGNKLQEAAKWGRFIAILFFIAIGFFLLGLTFSSARVVELMSVSKPWVAGNGGLLIAALFILAAIYVYIVIQLYQFTVLVKQAVERQDQETFNASLKALKNYFVINGIFTLVMLGWSLIETLSSLF